MPGPSVIRSIEKQHFLPSSLHSAGRGIDEVSTRIPRGSCREGGSIDQYVNKRAERMSLIEHINDTKKNVPYPTGYSLDSDSRIGRYFGFTLKYILYEDYLAEASHRVIEYCN